MKSTLIYNGEFQVVRIKNFTGGKSIENKNDSTYCNYSYYCSVLCCLLWHFYVAISWFMAISFRNCTTCLSSSYGQSLHRENKRDKEWRRR